MTTREKWQNNYSAIKQHHKKDEFTQEDALDAYAKSLDPRGKKGQKDLGESQRLHVGRLLSRLSKQHHAFEIDGRYILPPEKDVQH